MAANRLGRRTHSRSPDCPREPGAGIQRRQARVTVRYDRKELQNRLDVEQWIEGKLQQLYQEQEGQMPEEVNIDELLELQTDGERRSQLQIMLRMCGKNTDEFITELLRKLQGLHKVEVQKVGLESPQQH
ncbi:protein phosphatase 1, regulatory (inhibitor) subunit 14Ab [Chiloscyllium punctatum]